MSILDSLSILCLRVILSQVSRSIPALAVALAGPLSPPRLAVCTRGISAENRSHEKCHSDDSDLG